MKINKVRELDAAELASQDKEAQEQMFRLRLQMKMGQSEGLKKYRVLRKDRARMFTVERERQMASAAGPVTSASGPVTSKGKRQ